MAFAESLLLLDLLLDLLVQLDPAHGVWTEKLALIVVRLVRHLLAVLDVVAEVVVLEEREAVVLLFFNELDLVHDADNSERVLAVAGVVEEVHLRQGGGHDVDYAHCDEDILEVVLHVEAPADEFF